jgi:hypothetical protein
MPQKPLNPRLHTAEVAGSNPAEPTFLASFFGETEAKIEFSSLRGQGACIRLRFTSFFPVCEA